MSCKFKSLNILLLCVNIFTLNCKRLIKKFRLIYHILDQREKYFYKNHAWKTQIKKKLFLKEKYFSNLIC